MKGEARQQIARTVIVHAAAWSVALLLAVGAIEFATIRTCHFVGIVAVRPAAYRFGTGADLATLCVVACVVLWVSSRQEIITEAARIAGWASAVALLATVAYTPSQERWSDQAIGFHEGTATGLAYAWWVLSGMSVLFGLLCRALRYGGEGCRGEIWARKSLGLVLVSFGGLFVYGWLGFGLRVAIGSNPLPGIDSFLWEAWWFVTGAILPVAAFLPGNRRWRAGALILWAVLVPVKAFWP